MVSSGLPASPKQSGDRQHGFLRHGKVVKTDDLSDLYTNRPFGKLFVALREVEKYLQPVFAAAPEIPFPEKRKKGEPNITPGQIRRIRNLRRQGFKVKKIAEEVGVSAQTVHRHSNKK
jgi:DNA-binding NarL/FixJ family response regulator